MTKRIPQPRAELPPSVRLHEAKLLAVMLRTSRLTWVFSEPGADKSSLLRTGVLPLLQRRLGDRGQWKTPDASTAAAADRRRRSARPRSEVVIHFDDWSTTPLSALKRRINGVVPPAAAADPGATLSDMLRQLHKRSNLQFVVLLDRFEDYLSLATDEAEVGQFADELMQAVNQESVAANFLIAMEEIARPQLERFRARLPRFDANVLRLSPVSERGSLRLPAQARSNEPTTHAPRPHRPTKRVATSVNDVYELIESTLSRIRAAGHSASPPCELDLDLSQPARTEVQSPDAPGRNGNGRNGRSDDGQPSPSDRSGAGGRSGTR